MYSVMRVRILPFFFLFCLNLPVVLSADSQEFKVGIVLPLTGPLSLQGVPMKNAIQMAKNDFDTKNQFNLIIEDDGFLPKNTVLAAKKLIHRDKIQALMVFGTNQGLSVVTLSEQNKIPFLSINVNKTVAKERTHTVITLPSLEKLTELNIKESLRRGYKKISIIASQQDSCLLQRKIMEDSEKFEILYSDEIPPTETNIREFAFKAMVKKPDAIFLSVIPPQGSLLAKYLRELGYRGDIFGGQQIANLAEGDASKGGLIDAWVVAGDDRLATEFFRRYFDEFKEMPSTESIYAYDSMKLLISGVETGDLNKYLHEVNEFQGLGGTYSADGENGFTIPVVAKIFTKDGFKYIE